MLYILGNRVCSFFIIKYQISLRILALKRILLNQGNKSQADSRFIILKFKLYTTEVEFRPLARKFTKNKALSDMVKN